MKITAVFITLFMLICPVTLALGNRIDAPGVPRLEITFSYPEQELQGNLIHKNRVPRGGIFDITAVIHLKGASFTLDDRPRITISSRPELKPVKLWVDGKEVEKPSSSVPFEKSEAAKEIRWQYELSWRVRKAQAQFTFDVKADLSNIYADLRKSITVEQGMACYDTTYTSRVKMLSKNKYCRLESIGRSGFGREMYLLRVTDFDVPAAKKKQFIMIGAYHGDEPSGPESILDFVYELITKDENRRYLMSFTLYIIPCMNPDGRELGIDEVVNGIDLNYGFLRGKEPVEALNVATALQLYKPDFVAAIGMTTHQWWRPYLLLSHDCLKKWDWSDQLIKNVGIRISNEMDEYVHVQSSPASKHKDKSIRGYMYTRMGIPNFVLENVGRKTFNIGRQMNNIIREIRIYYAVLDFMLDSSPPRPKVRPKLKVTFPDSRNYKVYKVDKPPKIDGVLDDAYWQHESIITKSTSGEKRSKQVGKTTVHLVYDDRNLYIAYDVPDLKPSKIVGHDPNPGIWHEDGVDFMFDTSLNQWSYFQFQANVNGAFTDTYWPIPGIPDSRTFNMKRYKVAGSVTSGAIEIEIPFAEFNGHPEMNDPEISVPPKPGTVWGVNFIRNRPRWSWVNLGPNGTAHAPWLFNGMTFTGKKHK